ncbi:MAG: bis(5'-nucleosyl)-tetraphosphatase (symmetrical) YqeK [Ruminococcus sp.]|nr:bis(5'-nucleosyl)-tetraphosphatase (symmetrical) YqeK [Ruminococcus sp.]
MNYMERVDEFKALLSGRLKEKRYIHSLNVADSAVYLAEKYGADKDKAYIAGLLHDVTKNENENNQLQMLKDDGIILSQTELHNPKLWHAMSGAVYARRYLKIDDEEILGAIRYHTTGKAGMTLLEKVIYIADYISEERDYDDVDIMRKLAEESLDKAALYALKFSLKNLSKKEKLIHTNSVEFYNELIIKFNPERTDNNDRT